MAMPETLVEVRHGLSEPNIIQRLEKHIEAERLLIDPDTGEFKVLDPEIEEFAMKYAGFYALRHEVYARPDYLQRLSLEGIEQAKLARQWLCDNFIAPEDFDERYVSPFYRTMDTADVVGGQVCQWLVDTRLIERDWGIYGATPRAERADKFPFTEKMSQEASFFARFDGGESVHDTTYHVRSWIDTHDRDNGDKKVLAVTHGEKMWSTRAVVERLLPQEYHDMEEDKSLRIGNCCILIYQRTDPFDPEHKVKSLPEGWRLMIDPVEPEKSPYDGQWQKLQGKRRFSGAQLGDLTAKTPRLIIPS